MENRNFLLIYELKLQYIAAPSQNKNCQTLPTKCNEFWLKLVYLVQSVCRKNAGREAVSRRPVFLSGLLLWASQWQFATRNWLTDLNIVNLFGPAAVNWWSISDRFANQILQSGTRWIDSHINLKIYAVLKLCSSCFNYWLWIQQLQAQFLKQEEHFVKHI